MFTALVTEMEASTREKLFFNFRSILTPQQLSEQKQSIIAKFRKRNNPSEDDAPMLSDEFRNSGNNTEEEPVVSASKTNDRNRAHDQPDV